MEPDLMEILSRIRMGQLEGDDRLAADEFLRSMPAGFADIITGRTSLLSLYNYSMVLARARKIGRDVPEEAEKFVLGCSAVRVLTRASSRHTRNVRFTEKESIREGLIQVDAERRRRTRGENRELELVDFADYSGNEKELKQMLTAIKAADAFMELRNPRGEEFHPRDAKALYEYLFPNKDEAEDWDEAIIPRIKNMREVEKNPGAGHRCGDSRFHALVALNDGDVIGYTQFSTMPVNRQMVVYWQYGGVADRNFMKDHYHRRENFRQEGIGSAFYVFRHGIANEDARRLGYNGVVGTILESEFIGQAEDADAIRFTKKRLHIHRQNGAKAVILEMEDGRRLTAHIQPRLSADSNPLMMLLLYRSLEYSEADCMKTTEMDRELAQSLALSLIDNFEREGFNPADVEEARAIVLQRFREAKRVLLVPPEELGDITSFGEMDPLLKEQIERDYGSIEEHRKTISDALSSPTSIKEKRLGY